MTGSSKAAAGAFMILIVGLTLAPLLRDPHKGDSFPLSTYPMFARRATNAKMSLTYAVGLDAKAKRHYLRPDVVANGEVLQARAVLANARKRGKEAAKALCERIAAKVAVESDFSQVVHIQIVHGTHDAVAFLADDEKGKERAIADCGVKR